MLGTAAPIVDLRRDQDPVACLTPAQYLERAEIYADVGAERSVRQECAALVAGHLPVFARDAPMLCRLVGVLLLAHAYVQIERILRALHGTRATFMPASQPLGGGDALLCNRDGAELTIMLDERALRGRGAGERAARWSGRIVEMSEAG